MKKEYTNPELIVTSIKSEDIITLSSKNINQTTFNKKNFSEIQF